MLITVRLTAYATNMYFSTLPKEELEKKQYWKAHAINNKPFVLEFFGYIFFFPCYVLGPFLNTKITLISFQEQNLKKK